MDARRGGVVLRIDDHLAFVPASVGVTIAPAPQLARVPGAPSSLAGIALHEGEVVAVVAVGGLARTEATARAMLVCTYLGEKIGLVGAEIVETGFFEADPEAPEAVRASGGRAAPLDLAALYARVQGDGWAGRWGG